VLIEPDAAMSFGHHNDHNRKSYYKARKDSELTIPKDILERFEEGDIFKVWETLDKVFHLNLKYWQKQFRIAYAESSVSTPREETFYRFLKANLEKPLNIIRGNNEYEAIIDKIFRYVVRDKTGKSKQPEKINYSYPYYSKFKEV
jgi:hypothetical protein